MAIISGKILALRTQTDEAFPYYVFRPAGEKKPSKILVSVHGITRNALEHAARLAEYCQKNNILLIAPYFSRKRFRYFQTLQPDANGDRPSKALNEIIADVERRVKIDIGEFALLGYSGGGQFAHRYSLFYPEKISKMIINAAGWYTMPCFDTAYPEGLAINNTHSDLEFNFESFCEIPISVIIGSKDTKRESSLNKSSSIDETQGRNRLSRGENWVASINAFKKKFGQKANATLKIIENTGHDFSKNINNKSYYGAICNEISV